MPKKQPKNAFFFFMLDYKEKQEKRGVKYPGGLNQVSQECSKIWQTMDATSKAHYSDRAKNLKNYNSGKVREVEKFTSLGMSFKNMEKQKKAAMELEKEMKLTIDRIVDQATLEDRLGSQVFCMIACNYFCKVTAGNYTPAEVAVVKLSLQDGVIDTYHTLVNPGTLPLGMAYTAKSYADECHKLPTPPNALGEIIFSRIHQDIYDFIFDHDKNELRPLFTDQYQTEIVRSILNVFSVEADGQSDVFQVMPLCDLLHLLKKATAKSGQNMDGFASIHIAQAMIERDQYEFHQNLGCETHEELDCTKHCSLSQVKRYAYTICDHCCVDIGITLVPGQHVPVESKLPLMKIEEFDFDETTDDRRSEAYTFASSSKFSNSDFGGVKDRYYQKYPGGSDNDRTNRSYDDRDRYQKYEDRPSYRGGGGRGDYNRSGSRDYNDRRDDRHRSDRRRDRDDAADSVSFTEGAPPIKEERNMWSRKEHMPDSSFASKKDHDFYSFLK